MEININVIKPLNNLSVVFTANTLEVNHLT